jgi:hypothetical protein
MNWLREACLPYLLWGVVATTHSIPLFLQDINSYQGQFSTVTLIAVERGPGHADMKTAAGSEDGLIFHFAIQPRETPPGLFTLAEVRDFELAGRKYSEVTFGRLGRRFESSTIIHDVEDFRTSVRPDLAAATPTNAKDLTVVMSAIVSGCALDTDVPARVVLDVGWGKKTELFSIEFRIPAK